VQHLSAACQRVFWPQEAGETAELLEPRIGVMRSSRAPARTPSPLSRTPFWGSGTVDERQDLPAAFADPKTRGPLPGS